VASLGQPLAVRAQGQDMQTEIQQARHFNVYCPREMARAVDESAAKELISTSAWIRQAMRDRLQAEGRLRLDEPSA
jgi:predicted HicB family RNase H-like nuclease